MQSKHGGGKKQTSTCMNGDFHKLLTSKTQLKDVFKGDEKNVSQNSREKIRDRQPYVSATKMHPFYYLAMAFNILIYTDTLLIRKGSNHRADIK